MQVDNHCQETIKVYFNDKDHKNDSIIQSQVMPLAKVYVSILTTTSLNLKADVAEIIQIFHHLYDQLLKLPHFKVTWSTNNRENRPYY